MRPVAGLEDGLTTPTGSRFAIHDNGLLAPVLEISAEVAAEVYALYPFLRDDEFVKSGLDRWLN